MLLTSNRVFLQPVLTEISKIVLPETTGFQWCYELDTQLNKVGSSSELIYFYKLQKYPPLLLF